MSTFAETKQEEKGAMAAWLEANARKRPGLFTLLLLLLAAAVTIGLLLKTSQAIILYQGF